MRSIGMIRVRRCRNDMPTAYSRATFGFRHRLITIAFVSSPPLNRRGTWESAVPSLSAVSGEDNFANSKTAGKYLEIFLSLCMHFTSFATATVQREMSVRIT